jgi:peptidoglycan/LPS O-acetylase OafA/YrhL
VAVLLVVLYHAGVPGIKGGFVGVDVFFVLSGFLITDLLTREKLETGSASLIGFYARRMRRILPIATTVLLATVLASDLLLGFIRTGVIATDAAWASGFAANFHFAALGTNYLNAQLPPSPVQHYWSLAIEEQFYLVWPTVFAVVAWLSARRRLRVNLAVVLGAIAVASFAWSVVQTSSSPTVAYFSPFTRTWELALGALLAVSRPAVAAAPKRLGAILSWVGLAGIIGSAFWCNAATPFPGWAAAVPVLSTCFVLAGGSMSPAGGADVLLRRRPLQFIGDLSYSLYLWHWPLLIMYAEYKGRPPSLTANLILLVVALVLSYVGYRLIESPVRYSRTLTHEPVRALMLGGSLIALTLGITNGLHGVDAAASSASGRVPPAATTAQEVSDLVSKSSLVKNLPADLVPTLTQLPTDLPSVPVGCNTQTPTSSPKDCVFGDAAGKRTVVVLGDSHAEMWMPGIALAAKSAHWRAILVSRSGCPAPAVHELNAQTGQPDFACDSWRSWAIGHIRSLHPQMVVLSSMYFYPLDFGHHVVTPATWDRGLEDTLNRLREPRVTRVVLGDIPYLRQNPSDCLAANQDDIRTCGGIRASVLIAPIEGLPVTAAAAGARYVAVDKWFCSLTFCPAIVGRIGVYRDRAHVSATYSAWLWKLLGEALGL